MSGFSGLINTPTEIHCTSEKIFKNDIHSLSGICNLNVFVYTMLHYKLKLLIAALTKTKKRATDV